MNDLQKSTYKGVTCNKRGYWSVRLVGAKRKSCGRGPEGKKNAEALRKKFDEQKQTDRAVSLGLEATSEFATINDLMVWFLNSAAEQKKPSYASRISAYKALKRHLGDVKIDSLTIQHQEDYKAKREEEGASVVYATDLSFLRTCYLKAIMGRMIPASWRDKLPGKWLTTMKYIPRVIIRDDQYEKLLANAEDPEFKDIMICAWETAMRPTEIARLKVRQVHLDKPAYIGLGTDTKTKTVRTVPISTRLKEMLIPRLETRGPDDFVFFQIKRNKVGTGYAGYSNRFRHVCLKAGLPHGEKTLNDKGEKIGLLFYCFRHTRITKWIKADHSDEVIRKATGHTNFSSYRKYSHLDSEIVSILVD